MNRNVIVIGAGLSGLTAAALLAKRGLSVTVIEQAADPGGSCGAFRRGDALFERGAAMLYGFGERGFNAHRFVFNCLEEPFEAIRHELLYTIVWQGRRVCFFSDIDRFVEELSAVFPNEQNGIRRFYRDMKRMYKHVMAERPAYTTPDETNPRDGLRGIVRHPLSYLRFLSYMNISAERLLRRYFKGDEILRFFDKLTSTYCYATVREAPAIMASVMFVDNHIGGSYYPAGSTLQLVGRLEKSVEQNGGAFLYNARVERIIFESDTPVGVRLTNGRALFASDIVFSGTVWNLYEKLVPRQYAEKRLSWAKKQLPTYPSLALYALVDKSVIDGDACPIELLVGNEHAIDESEITVYILSLDDRTLCSDDCHVVMAIGPSFLEWSDERGAYERQKKAETERLLRRLEQRFLGFSAAVRHAELATPKTIERFTLKNGGAAAGPRQIIGQHMLSRQHIQTDWDGLYCCGESTVLGTGTPTVTTSGIAAANAILKKHGLPQFRWQPNMKSYVSIKKPPFDGEPCADCYSENERECIQKARRCLCCLSPRCCPVSRLDVRGIMRRAQAGNLIGAKKALSKSDGTFMSDNFLCECERRCVRNADGAPAPIAYVINHLKNM